MGETRRDDAAILSRSPANTGFTEALRNPYGR